MTGGAQGTRIRVAALAAVLLAAGTALAERGDPPQPSQRDKCPVCGMFVYKYPDWIAEIVFDDGSAVFFDGAKDLFKFFLDMGKYSPGRDKRAVAGIFVREYYNIQPMDARKAYFVTGSDVYGPMGHELIPLASLEDARTFLKDHKGDAVLRFEEISPAVIRELD
ncbi:MAG: nitrous oxide reductase accessory protein NosL [bacterium]|nr:MAG: nitrous oxide reductase accessory protein NosL [bacterium]